VVRFVPEGASCSGRSCNSVASLLVTRTCVPVGTSQVEHRTGEGKDGWFYNTAAEDEVVQWNGPFESEEVAKTQGRNATSFKRLLLNKCQEQFMSADAESVRNIAPVSTTGLGMM
jgi:hypothetical protein